MCLGDGSCAAGTDVAYADADAGSDNGACSGTAPCRTVLAALATGRPYLKLKGRFNEAITTDNGRKVRIIGEPSALLSFNGAAPAVLQVKGVGTAVVLEDILVGMAASTGTNGIVVVDAALSLGRVTVGANPGYGISVQGGSIEVTQSIIASNSAGGMQIQNAQFRLVGNVFRDNGTDKSAFGALSIQTAYDPGNSLEFNTFVNNHALDGAPGAIYCLATFNARNNLLSQNTTLTSYLQVSGSCHHSYTLVWPGPPLPGDGNVSGDPLFVDPRRDWHVTLGSPAIAKADPAEMPTGRDADGNPILQPATIGAYQHVESPK